ncbi:transient receptor potential cation channel subfamily A member 1 homolog isoform X1 [Rhopilema esculentum]|uniref:transient receptor potential cation channel subfamily A member 1 homolog isoform X1 n=1 Tax=Rhopilema esculentum TaxID=499914 RepID=UPI0031D5C45D
MALHKVAKEGDLALLKSEIEDLRDNVAEEEDISKVLGVTDAHHLTPLHYAVKYQHVDIVRILLRNGADVNVKGENGTTCLHFGARYFDLEDPKAGEEILDLLLAAKGVNVNAADNDMATPLHYACLKNNYKAVRKFLNAKNIYLESRDRWESTPLQAACSVGSIAIVKRLLKSGAHVDVINEAHNCPLHLACSGGHEDVVIEIFDQTERLYGYSSLSKMICSQNREGQTPLHVAVLASHFHIIKILLERGASVNQIMAEGETALHIAAVTGHLAITRLLLSHEGMIDAKNDEGRTPLHKAAAFGKSNVVELLLERGASVNIQGRFKVTALMLAASSNYPSIVALLLHKEANIAGKDFEGRTALHLAAAGNSVEAIKVLLEDKRASSILNEQDKDGNTALHISCVKGFDEITKILLSANVDVTPRNNLEQTPAHMAALFGRSDVVEDLLEKDASTINDIDKQGNAALHLAAEKGHTGTIKVLLNAGASINDRNTDLLTPLDCAARAGQMDAAKTLLNAKASVDPMHKHGMTPLLHASIHGHGKMVELLLQVCDISLTDRSGRNCLDLAIDHNRKDAAMAILSHRDWKMAMRNKTIEERTISTPMRKLIKKLPEVGSFALNRCLRQSESLPPDHPDYHITLEYEFLDDVFNDWPMDAVRLDNDEGKGRGDLLTREEIARQLRKKKNHTLSVMAENKREELLSHPLVTNLLAWKWNLFSGHLYYLKLFLYFVFLFFLTGYVLHTAPMRQPFRNENCQINMNKLKNDFFDIIFIRIGTVVIVGLALLHLIFELVQLIAQKLDYISFENAIEILVYLLAIVNVSDDVISLPVTLSCTVYQQSIGSYAVFLSWINLILFLRKVPKFGIYIVMFGFVVNTFLEFFLVFVLLIVAFALGFYILFADAPDIGTFQTPWKSIVKTLVMMSGELDFGSIFDGSQKPPPAAWPLFLMFVLLLTIILMNLLVGLAVDDIQEVQKQAVLNRMKMQIDLMLDTEKSLPGSLRRKCIAKDQIVYPNRGRRWFSQLKQSDNFMKALNEALKSEKTILEELKLQTIELESKSVSMEKKIVKIGEQFDKFDRMEDQLSELKDESSLNCNKEKYHRSHWTCVWCHMSG